MHHHVVIQVGTTDTLSWHPTGQEKLYHRKKSVRFSECVPYHTCKPLKVVAYTHLTSTST